MDKYTKRDNTNVVWHFDLGQTFKWSGFATNVICLILSLLFVAQYKSDFWKFNIGWIVHVNHLLSVLVMESIPRNVSKLHYSDD